MSGFSYINLHVSNLFMRHLVLTVLRFEINEEEQRKRTLIVYNKRNTVM